MESLAWIWSVVRIAIFVLFLLVALGYAAWRGGGPERAVAAIAAMMLLSDQLLHLMVPPTYGAVDIGHLGIDIFGAISTFTVAMLAHRFWPLIAAPLHMLPLIAHSSRALDISMEPVAYLAMQVASSWLVPPLLILATWRHQRRLAVTGSDPSWSGSSRRSNPTIATD